MSHHTHPYLDKSTVYGWLQHRLSLSAHLLRAQQPHCRQDVRLDLLRELTDELVRAHPPERYGLTRSILEHEVLRVVDPYMELEHPSWLVEYPAFDPNLFHGG
jgi:hypothetical protein